MPHEYLSDDQVGRYGRFVADPPRSIPGLPEVHARYICALACKCLRPEVRDLLDGRALRPRIDTVSCQGVPRTGMDGQPCGRPAVRAADLRELMTRVTEHQQQDPQHQPLRRPPDKPRRTYNADHLAGTGVV